MEFSDSFGNFKMHLQNQYNIVRLKKMHLLHVHTFGYLLMTI